MNRIVVKRALMGLLILVCAGPLLAAERQSLTSIHLQAENFLDQFPYPSVYPVQYQITELDPRLNLRMCGDSLDISFTRPDKTIGNTSLQIRCRQPVQWKIHLPAKVILFDDAVMTKTALLRGQDIPFSALTLRKIDVSGLSQGYFKDLNELVHYQAKRNLASNTVLSPAHLSMRQMVKSGQKITVLLKMNGLQIKTTGRALQSASLGQWIKVRNEQSNKIIEGVVSAAGQVTVSL